MSKFTHNNVIMCLEEVVPQMQNSDDPINTLLKYAKQHNFSPAQLERVGHMFNSLKTNSAYNLAKTAADRGNYISTLDVPELLDKYASFVPEEIDFKGMKDISGIKLIESNMSKKASANNIGSIRDLFLEDAVMTDEEIKQASEVEELRQKLISDFDKRASSRVIIPEVKQEYEIKANDPVDYVEACKTARQHCITEIMKAVDVMENITNKFATIYKSRNPKYASFDKVEHAAVLCSEDKSEIVKEAMEDLAKRIKSKSVWLNNNLKTASETGLYDKYKIAKEAPKEMLDIISYVEAYEHCKEAAALKKEIEDDVLNNENFKVAKTITSTQDDIYDNLADQINLVDKNLNIVRTQAPDNFAELAKLYKERQALLEKQQVQDEKFEKNTEHDEDRKRQSDLNVRADKDYEYNVKKREILDKEHEEDRKRQIEENERKLKEHDEDRKRQSDLNERADKDYEYNVKKREILDKEHAQDRKHLLSERSSQKTKAIIDSLSAASSDVGNLLGKTTESAANSIGSLRDNYSNIFRQIDEAKASGLSNAMLSPIQREIKDLTDRTTLESLMFTDPILSNLSEPETEALMDIYNTITRRNPEIASDKGLLRSLLRQAVAAGGVDVNALKTISQI